MTFNELIESNNESHRELAAKIDAVSDQVGSSTRHIEELLMTAHVRHLDMQGYLADANTRLVQVIDRNRRIDNILIAVGVMAAFAVTGAGIAALVMFA